MVNSRRRIIATQAAMTVSENSLMVRRKTRGLLTKERNNVAGDHTCTSREAMKKVV